MSKKKLGILGGTFDPVHYGHMAMAEVARQDFNLDLVLFIPTGAPPHKTNITKPIHRYNMLKLALNDFHATIVEDFEVNREGYTYTIDTLKQVHEKYQDFDIFYIIGTDTLLDLRNWRKFEKVAKSCSFIVYERPNINKELVKQESVNLYKEFGADLKWADGPLIDLSSTFLRNRIQNNLTLKFMVPLKVEEYIYEYGLYLPEEPAKEPDLVMVKNHLKSKLSKERYKHVLGTVKAARKLAEIFGADIKKAEIAAFLHDIAKSLNDAKMLEKAKEYNIPINEKSKSVSSLLHAAVSAEIAKREYNIYDVEILNAIRYHTTGKEMMSLLEKIIFLADFIEDNRDYKEASIIRNILYKDKDLDKGLLKTCEFTIKHVLSKDDYLDIDTVRLRNEML